MIRKSLLVTVIALAVYSVFTVLIRKRYFVPQSQRQENIIAAQRYIYQAEDVTHVIVGSSISAKLSKTLLPGQFYNLSFRGKSAYDGLEILKRTGRIPQVILIEINEVDNPEDTRFEEDLFAPGLYYLKKGLPVLQEENQILNTGTYLISSLLIKENSPLAEKLGASGIKKDYRKVLSDTSEVKLVMSEAEKRLSGKVIEAELKKWSKLPDSLAYAQRLQSLRDYVTYFSSHGASIVFFQVPVHTDILQSPYYSYMWRKLYQAFPPEQYTYLPTPHSKRYVTKDGFHLTEESAQMYTAYLLQELSKLKSGVLVRADH